MAYRNQNYMVNKKIKAEIDKNQKGYVDPEENQEEEITFTPITYSFISYGDEEGETIWGEGTVKTTENVSNGFTQVEVVTNSTDQDFIGEKFFITSDAKTDGTIYPLFIDAGETPAGIYVSISTE